MKIYVHLFLTIILIFVIDFCLASFPQTKVIGIKQGRGLGGVWKSKTHWKARWVKQWELKKVWVAVWKKVWSPVQLKEWIPIPKIPPPQPPSWTPHHH